MTTRLSAQDASFLALESETSPMHVGGLVLLEGPPLLDGGGHFRIDDLRRAVESRLPLVPRFRQRLHEVPLQQGRPVWADDDAFDISYHVRLTALPRPGTEAQLRALFARLQAAPLDRRRPLWEVWFVEGLEDDRVALVSKTHHALVDGVASIDVAALFFTLEPSEAPPPDAVEPWEPALAPNAAQLLGDALVERAGAPARAVRALLSSARDPAAAAGEARGVGGALGTLTSTAAPRLPFNAPVGPHRRFELARVGLGEVKRVRRATGGTVNDVVLAVVAGGLRSYLEGADVPVEGLVPKALVPVSVRAEGEELGNRVAGVVADLPVGEADPVARVKAVAGQLSELKGSGQAAAVDRIGVALDLAPPPLLDLAARLVPFQRAVNLVVTNIPGPQFPLWCLGSRLLEIFPYVGIVSGLGLTVAVVSYEGQLGFGLTGDRDLTPDLARLAEGIERAAADLVAAIDDDEGTTA